MFDINKHYLKLSNICDYRAGFDFNRTALRCLLAYFCDTSQWPPLARLRVSPLSFHPTHRNRCEGFPARLHLAVHCLSSGYVFVSECSTVETISLVVIDGPVVCSLAGWLPRAVSEYLSFQLVALSGAADIVLWMRSDPNRRLQRLQCYSL